MSKRRVKSSFITKRRCRTVIRVLPLNLPDRIWQQYRKSLNSSVAENTNSAIVSTPHSSQVGIDYPHTSTDTKIQTSEIEPSDKSLLKDSILKNSIIKKNENSILKKLLVKVDNSYKAQYNCLFLSKRLTKSIEIHKNTYENISSVKEILTNCSVRALLQPKENSNSFSSHIISADTQLDNVLELIQKQEQLLVSLQKTFHEFSLPLSIWNHYSIKENDYQRLSNLVDVRENEIQILKLKQKCLDKELLIAKEKLITMKHVYQKEIQEREKRISHMKQNIVTMKKRLRIIVTKNNKKSPIESNTKPSQIQVQQLQNLMMLTNSLMENILGTQTQIDSSSNRDEIITNLNKQIIELKKKNKQKDNEVQRLIVDKKQTAQQILAIHEERKIELEQKDLEIFHLTYTLDNLKKKQDRWLVDKFHQKCHSIMLFEKMRQIELQKNLYSSIKKLEDKTEDKTDTYTKQVYKPFSNDQ